MQTDLLKTRIKVLSPYPLSPYKVGDYMELSENRTSGLTIQSFDNAFWMPVSEIIKMPLIFRTASWWEDRTPEEMPMYVKNKKSVFKVPKWIYRDKSWHFVNENPHVGIGIETYNLSPATEQDHINYISKKVKL